MSQVTSVNGANSALQSTTRSIEDQLGLDDFLNILVAELQNQNPLEPMDNTEMTSQIAQFSMLDGISSLQSSISEMKSLEMIGKDVIAFDPVSGSYVQGIVGGIIRQNGEIYLNVGGSYVSFENIMQVKAIDDLYGGNNGGFGSGLSAEGLETAASIIDFARQFLGYPYVLGAESRKTASTAPDLRSMFTANSATRSGGAPRRRGIPSRVQRSTASKTLSWATSFTSTPLTTRI